MHKALNIALSSLIRRSMKRRAWETRGSFALGTAKPTRWSAYAVNHNIPELARLPVLMPSKLGAFNSPTHQTASKSPSVQAPNFFDSDIVAKYPHDARSHPSSPLRRRQQPHSQCRGKVQKSISSFKAAGTGVLRYRESNPALSGESGLC